MIVGESMWRKWTRFRHFKPEEEFHLRMKENPVWPFEDLGNGFFYFRIYSDNIGIGVFFLIIASVFTFLFAHYVGFFTLPATLIACIFIYGIILLYGNMSMRELIINREFGYMLRMHTNEKILVEQPIRNLYIRLREKIDTVGEYWYHIILGGYSLDDINLSRLSSNRSAMRKLGKRLARHMGINYFDVEDTSTLHKVFHYHDKSILVHRTGNILKDNLIFVNDAQNNKQTPSKIISSKGH